MGFFPGFGRKPDKSPQAPPPGTPPTEFDELAFSDHVQDFGRAYRHRTTELIRICQRFFGPADQSFDQNKALSKVLDMCDRTIEGAMKSRKKGSIEVDDLFVMATKDLQEYELDFLKRRTVIAAMADATKKDKRKRRDSPRPNDDKFVNVEFRIMSSLPCKNPIIVKQRLSSTTGLIVLAEILRNFSHFPKESRQRLCLAQNPRFYTASDLPEAPSGYKGSFSRQPTEKYEGTIYVLTNNLDPESGHSRRVFFEFGGQKRAFDNFWDTNKTSSSKMLVPETSQVKRSSKDQSRPEPSRIV